MKRESAQDEGKPFNRVNPDGTFYVSPEVIRLSYRPGCCNQFKVQDWRVSIVNLDDFHTPEELHELFAPNFKQPLIYLTFSGDLYKKDQHLLIASNKYSYCLTSIVESVETFGFDDHHRAKHCITVRIVRGLS